MPYYSRNFFSILTKENLFLKPKLFSYAVCNSIYQWKANLTTLSGKPTCKIVEVEMADNQINNRKI